MIGTKFILHGLRFGLIGVLVKFLIVMACVMIILYILKKDNIMVFCKNCKSKVSKKDKNCKECGQQLSDDNKEIVVKKTSKKAIALCVSVPVVILAVLITSVVALSSRNDFFFELCGSPGIYLERYEDYDKQKSEWNIECHALTDGVLKKVINKEHEQLKKLIIKNNTVKGNMKLLIEQGNKKEVIDIADSNDGQSIDLSDYNDNTIRLSIEHGKNDIDLQFRWE